MTSPMAVEIVPEQSGVEVPHPLLRSIRTDLLNSLLMADSARNPDETAASNALFLRSLAQAHVLAYRASFRVIVNHRGQKSIDVCFTHDASLEF